MKTPDDLRAALDGNEEARAAFEAMTPSHRKEYIAWIVEAKKPETRARRIGQAVDMLLETQPRQS